MTIEKRLEALEELRRVTEQSGENLSFDDLIAPLAAWFATLPAAVKERILQEANYDPEI